MSVKVGIDKEALSNVKRLINSSMRISTGASDDVMIKCKKELHLAGQKLIEIADKIQGTLDETTNKPLMGSTVAKAMGCTCSGYTQYDCPIHGWVIKADK